MKKAICLLMSFVIILSFTACKSKKAVKSADNSSVSSTPKTEVENALNEKFKGETDCINAAVGEWEFCSKYESKNGLNSIKIFKDYTIEIDGKKGTWDFPKSEQYLGNKKVSESYDKQDINGFKICIDLSDGTNDEFKIYKPKKYDVYDDYYVLKISGKGDTFLNSSVFETITITLDNYKNYFDLKDYFVAGKDKFGDYTDDLTFGLYLALKDGIKANDTMSSVEYKYSFTVGTYGFQFDNSNGAYKLSDKISAYDDVYQTDGHCLKRDDGVYAGSIGSSNVSKVEPGMGITNYKYIAEYPENINITGIMGTLYLYK